MTGDPVEVESSPLSSTGATIARGVGAVVVGPLVAGALESGEVQRAVRGLLIQLAISVGVGVAVGVWIGRKWG